MDMTKKFNFEEVKEKAVRLADKHLEEGLEEIQEGAKDASGTGTTVTSQATSQMEPVPAVSAAATVKRAMETEPTKGIQTNVPMSVYRRLNDIKLSRGETIGNLVAEAVLFWLDVQEGKKKVSATT